MEKMSIYVYFNNFRKNQTNETKIFSRKCNSRINNGKLSGSESYTIKQIKINMSMDLKLSKAQLSKMIQSNGFRCNMLGNLGKKRINNITIPLARDNLPGLVSNLASSAINKFERKISGKGAVRAGKEFTLFIWSEDMNNIIKIIK